MSERNTVLTEAQIEQITRIVTQVVQSQPEAVSSTSGGWLSLFFAWVFSRGLTLPLVITAMLTIAGLVLYGISPVQLAELPAQKYREAELLGQTVDRYLTAGDSFLDNNRPTAAKAQFKRALELDPRNPEAQLGLEKANLFIPITEKYYDPSLAQQKLTQFLSERDINNDCGADKSSKGSLHHTTLGHFAPSLENPRSENPRSENTSNTHIYAYLGDVALYDATRGKAPRKNALHCYKRAIALDSHNSYAYFGMGTVYLTKSDYQSALGMFDKALRGGGEGNQGYRLSNQEYLLSYAYALYQANEGVNASKHAIQVDEDIIRWDPYFLPAYFDLIYFYQVDDKQIEARAQESERSF